MQLIQNSAAIASCDAMPANASGRCRDFATDEKKVLTRAAALKNYVAKTAARRAIHPR
jgi:hypothetical protein